MKRSGIALGALIALSVPSLAADLGWSNPAPSPVFSGSSASSWGGFYAGINGGFGWGTTSNAPALPGGTVDNNSNGWMLGGQAGYNMDLGGFVIGAEADLQWANIGYSEPAPGALGTFSSKIDLLSTGRIRAGIPVGPVMPYATVGGAFGRGTTSVDNGVLSSTASNHFGWTAGVGLEAQATPNLSFKAEYLYVDLGSQAYNGLPVGDRDVGQRFSVVRAGVNYKF